VFDVALQHDRTTCVEWTGSPETKNRSGDLCYVGGAIRGGWSQHRIGLPIRLENVDPANSENGFASTDKMDPIRGLFEAASNDANMPMLHIPASPSERH
jgi:hypothetical protein